MPKFNIDGMEFETTDYDLVKFSDKLVVGAMTVRKDVTAEDVDNVMCTAFEGGIGYWAGVDNTGAAWAHKPKTVCLSEWCSLLLINGKSFNLYDVEDETEVWTLDIKKLIHGIELNAKERPHDCDLERGDATTADCIIQYALFGKVVYG